VQGLIFDYLTVKGAVVLEITVPLTVPATVIVSDWPVASPNEAVEAPVVFVMTIRLGDDWDSRVPTTPDENNPAPEFVNVNDTPVFSTAFP
jgi:hypothetical protein